MTLLPFTDCCLLLGVDPKTLRLWLTSAHLSCTVHPSDARLKCLTPSQLHHLAKLHDRFLPDPLPGEASERGSSPAFASPLAQAASPQESPAASSVAAPPPDADLRHQFTLLQAHVASLQEHVTQLALEARCPYQTRPASLPCASSHRRSSRWTLRGHFSYSGRASPHPRFSRVV